MDLTYNLADIIQSNGSICRHLENELSNSPKLRMLYQGIKDNLITDDESASQLLYESHSKSAGLRELKRRLKYKIIDSLIFAYDSDSADILESYTQVRQVPYSL